MKAGWTKKTIAELCRFRGGGTPSKAVDRYWKGEIPWVSPKDMKFEVVSDSMDHISKEAVQDSATSLIPSGSVLMVVRSGILARTVPIAITGCDLTINQDLKAFCPSKAIEARFLYYFLHSKMDLLLSLVSRGATVHRLITDHLRSLEVYLPPLPEQQRIVTILDEAFEGIATAKANAEKNLQNAREVFESQLQAALIQRKAGWVEKMVGDLATFSSGGTPSKQNLSYWGGEIPWVSGRDMKKDRIGDSALHISTTAVEESATRIAPVGSLLILVRGMGLANGIPIAELVAPCAFNQDIKGIHANAGIDPRFLLFSLRTKLAQSDQILSNAAHGTLKIDMEDLRKVCLLIPPLESQMKTVGQIDGLQEEIQHLELIYQQKLTSLDDLKQSLLHRAFNGDL